MLKESSGAFALRPRCSASPIALATCSSDSLALGASAIVRGSKVTGCPKNVSQKSCN